MCAQWAKYLIVTVLRKFTKLRAHTQRGHKSCHRPQSNEVESYLQVHCICTCISFAAQGKNLRIMCLIACHFVFNTFQSCDNNLTPAPDLATQPQLRRQHWFYIIEAKVGDSCEGISSRACERIDEASCEKGSCECKVGLTPSADRSKCQVTVCEAGKTLSDDKKNCVPGKSSWLTI